MFDPRQQPRIRVHRRLAQHGLPVAQQSKHLDINRCCLQRCLLPRMDRPRQQLRDDQPDRLQWQLIRVRFAEGLARTSVRSPQEHPASANRPVDHVRLAYWEDRGA
jgi:hypothetical protein